MKKGFIRGVSVLSGYHVQRKGEGCSLTYVSQVDLKGKSVVVFNLNVTDISLTFRNFRPCSLKSLPQGQKTSSGEFCAGISHHFFGQCGH